MSELRIFFSPTPPPPRQPPLPRQECDPYKKLTRRPHPLYPAASNPSGSTVDSSNKVSPPCSMRLPQTPSQQKITSKPNGLIRHCNKEKPHIWTCFRLPPATECPCVQAPYIKRNCHNGLSTPVQALRGRNMGERGVSGEVGWGCAGLPLSGQRGENVRAVSVFF